MIDIDILRKRLINDFNYPEENVDSVVSKLNVMSPNIYAAFETWFNTGNETNVEVEGYNYASIKLKDSNMNPIAVYLTLDWLAREPIKAKAALERPYTPLRRTKKM